MFRRNENACKDCGMSCCFRDDRLRELEDERVRRGVLTFDSAWPEFRAAKEALAFCQKMQQLGNRGEL